METITIVGAGVAGMTAAISLAEAGAPVVLFDTREAPGGRARSLDGPYRANLGPHVLYKDGAMFRWLGERALLPPIAGVPLTGLRLRWGGELHRTPPLVADPVDPEAARPSRAGGRELPRLGGGPHRRAHGRAAVERRRRLLLPPRPRVAVGRVRLGAHGPHAADAAARRALPARRLAGAGRPARHARRGARRRAPLRRARGRALRDHDRRHRAGRRGAPAGRAVRRRQRAHGLRRPRGAAAPRRPVRRLRPRRVRLDRALHGAGPVAGPGGGGADPGPDAGAPGREHATPPRRG